MRITREDVEHVALLARLELTEQEKDEFASQLDEILNYADKLNELDTEGVEPTAQVLEMRNVVREDKARSCGIREEALQNAPEREGSYFKVPSIMEG